jgi:ribosomal protein S27AE
MSGQIKCSKCGSTNINQSSNKSKIISYASHFPIYAKKYTCNNCGNEWQ